jgi:hypothetical protein|tara:strand:+ start:298 stop:474 length:177 start_codon:yes stop_codon:yes gene_type:complete
MTENMKKYLAEIKHLQDLNLSLPPNYNIGKELNMPYQAAGDTFNDRESMNLKIDNIKP